jgi:hypothetical protein
VATGEQPSSPVREEVGAVPPLVDDPAGQQQMAAADTGCGEAAHTNSESIRRFEEILREEAREMLTGYLRDGTEYLSASMVRRVVQVASMSVVGSAIAVSRLDKEVHRVTTTYPDEDPAPLADHMVRMCEEEVLDWMRTRTAHPCPDADPDPAGGPMGQELVEDLEKTITKEEANKYPPPVSKKDAWMMKVLEQATKVLCLAEEACDKTTKGDWQPCTYQRYRWQMDQEVGHLYALFGGPEEDEVRVKGRRLAKAWLAKAHDSVEGAREHMGLQLRRAFKLNMARQCQHDGPPAESRPCEEQARTAIQRADCAWEGGPRRMRELCGEYPDTAGWPTRGTMPVGAPGGGSEFSPGPADNRSDSDSSESSDSDSSDSETEDSGSSETGTEDSAPFDVKVRRRGPLTSDSSSSDSSSSDTEEWDSSSADSGFEKPSSSDAEGEIVPSAQLLEEIEEIGRVLAGLRGRAMQQVRRFLIMLARMRKDLSPSARIQVIRELGWRLGSSRESGGASRDDRGPEPTRPPGGTSRIMNYLEDWRRIYEDGKERRRTLKEEVAAPDDSLACAEEWLAAKRAAEREKRAKGVEQRLPVIAARLSILWSEVTGSGLGVSSSTPFRSGSVPNIN